AGGWLGDYINDIQETRTRPSAQGPKMQRRTIHHRLQLPLPPNPTPFPYTTLFRSSNPAHPVGRFALAACTIDQRALVRARTRRTPRRQAGGWLSHSINDNEETRTRPSTQGPKMRRRTIHQRLQLAFLGYPETSNRE